MAIAIAIASLKRSCTLLFELSSLLYEAAVESDSNIMLCSHPNRKWCCVYRSKARPGALRILDRLLHLDGLEDVTMLRIRRLDLDLLDLFARVV